MREETLTIQTWCSLLFHHISVNIKEDDTKILMWIVGLVWLKRNGTTKTFPFEFISRNLSPKLIITHQRNREVNTNKTNFFPSETPQLGKILPLLFPKAITALFVSFNFCFPNESKKLQNKGFISGQLLCSLVSLNLNYAENYESVVDFDGTNRMVNCCKINFFNYYYSIRLYFSSCSHNN